MLTKTQELIEEGQKITLRTATEETKEVVTAEVVALDAAKEREILYVENDIRVLQARLEVLRAEKAKTAEMAARAKVVQPEPKPEAIVEGGTPLKVGK